jgi:ADP-ribosylglycohydrolase
MIGGGLGGWEPGEWTDDTQMALCIGQVTAAGTLDPESVAARFLDWYRSGPADVGVQTRGVLGAATGPSDVSVRSAAYLTAHPDRSAGNGSLMRTAPVALAHLGDDAAIATSARRMSDLTHGDPVAGDACVLWCIAIDRAIRQGRLDGIHDAIQFLNTDRQTFWTDRILEAEQQPPSTFNPNGYVVDALRAAYSAVIQTPIPNQLPCLHLQHALATAVRIGNDTDTVAAIAGSLLGARWGASAVPARCKTLLHGWPGLTTPDLIRLAVMSARSGQPDSTGWPAADTLRPYYDQHFPTQPVDVALADDPGVRIGNFAALSTLADQPPDVVVSLCRIGPDDIPPGSSSYQVWLMDEPNTEQNPNLDFLLTDLGEQICAWRDAGRSVFIHCVMAESRTPTVAAAYLARRRSLSGAQAIDRVRSLLPSSRPNPGFLAALDKMWPAL